MKKADVLIIGGGIIGVSAAFFLAKKNIDVVLIENFLIGREASGANAGTLSIQNKELDMIPFAKEGVKLWAFLQKELNENIEFYQPGGIRVAERIEEIPILLKAIQSQIKMGLNVSFLSKKQLQSFAPYLDRSLPGAAFCQQDSRVNPLIASNALAKAAMSSGAKLHVHEMVEKIRQQKNNSFFVETSKNTYHAHTLLNCAGVWSKSIFRMIGIEMPITLSPQQMIVTEQVPSLFPHIISHIKGKLTIKQVPNGNVLIGGGWEGWGDLDRNTTKIRFESLKGNAQKACRIISDLKNINIIRCWIGSEGRTPDHLPLVGNLKNHPNFYVACCAKGGFTLGPLMARVISEIISEGKTPWPIDKYNPNRFFSF